MKTNTVTYPDAVQAAYEKWAECENRIDGVMGRGIPNDKERRAALDASTIAYAALCAVCRAHGIDPNTLDYPR